MDQDTYSPNEKIDCNFLLNLEQPEDANVYNARINSAGSKACFQYLVCFTDHQF